MSGVDIDELAFGGTGSVHPEHHEFGPLAVASADGVDGVQWNLGEGIGRDVALPVAAVLPVVDGAGVPGRSWRRARLKPSLIAGIVVEITMRGRRGTRPLTIGYGPGMTPAVNESGLIDAVELDVFTIGPDGELLPIRPTASGGADAEPHHNRAAANGVISRLGELRAQPGHRLGVVVDRAQRRGDFEEIMQPLAVRPGAARAVVVTGELFAEPIPSLEVNTASRVFDGDSITWNASVRTGLFSRPRAAALHLHPSPSANLSIIELIPSKRRRFHTHRFVSTGVVAVDILGSRLRRLAAESAPTPYSV